MITGVRTACDGTIVSYDIDIDGVKSTRHRKYLHKMNVNNIDDKDLNLKMMTRRGKFHLLMNEFMQT